MTLDEIKKWKAASDYEKEHTKTTSEVIDWLIAEVERSNAREATARMLVEITQEETAKRCADICEGMPEDLPIDIAQAIRREFSIDDR